MSARFWIAAEILRGSDDEFAAATKRNSRSGFRLSAFGSAFRFPLSGIRYLVSYFFLLPFLRVQSRVKPSLTGIILEELAGFLRERGAPSYRAKQITEWIYKKRVASFDAMTDLPNELRS